jgi:polyribonucleotide 5'-hydroxyl-kinase
MTSEEISVEAKEWVLEPETEYRFELDPGTSLAIKVCVLFFRYRWWFDDLYR